jgi:hypothetical protein
MPTGKHVGYAIGIALAVVCSSITASAQPESPGAEGREPAGDLKVWVLNGLERVLRDDPAGSRTAIALYAARNEWESCQIALRSSKFVRINDLTPEFFTHPSGAFLTVDNFRIYREHQLHLEHASRRNENFREGWYPDPLIPFYHPLTFQRLTEGRFSAVPFNLPPDETHAFWIDFYIPEDSMPGRYKGAFNVLVEGQGPVRVPIEIEVWDFALPKRAAMYTQFGSPADRISRYYEQLVRKGEIEEETDYDKVRKE